MSLIFVFYYLRYINIHVIKIREFLSDIFM